MKQERQVLTLLLLEKGALWPSWSGELRARAHNVIVEAQLDEEGIEAFGARMVARIEKLRERGDRVLGAGYVCSSAPPGIPEAVQDDVRGRIGGALVRLLEPSPDGVLILGGGDWTANAEVRRARSRVLELWARLSEISPQHPVGVRFEEAQASSGVFQATARPSPSARQKTA